MFTLKPKKYLLEAARKLIIEKGIDNITVQDILDESSVSRATFYKYYRDKYDLANAFYGEYVTENILPRYDGTNWDVLLVEILRFVKENKSYFRQLTDLEIHSFAEFVGEYGKKGYRQTYLVNTGKKELSSEEEYRLEFYNAGCVRVITCWINDGCAEKPDYIARLLFSLMPDVYHTVDSTDSSAALNAYGLHHKHHSR